MTITPELDTRYKSKHNTFPVVILVRHKNQTRRIPTGYKISVKYWAGEKVSTKHPDHRQINNHIDELVYMCKQYRGDCDRTGRPIRLDRIGKENNSYLFSEFLTHRAGQYKARGKIVMWQKLNRFAKELTTCFGPLYFDEIDSEKLNQYESYLIDQGNVENTRHKKFKFLSEVYSAAVQDGKADNPNPFKAYKIPTRPVRKEKLSTTELKAIEELPLQPGRLNDDRNLALFSYYCKGARFETCITFKRENIRGDRLLFISNKGGKPFSVKIHPRLQKIIDQYREGEYLFPQVLELPADPLKYKKLLDVQNTLVNRSLKIIAGLCEIKINLTFHIMRHSFAWHLKKTSTSIHVIKDALNHSDSRTTEIYLKALDDEILDGEMEKLYGQ
jgi:integrase